MDSRVDAVLTLMLMMLMILAGCEHDRRNWQQIRSGAEAACNLECEEARREHAQEHPGEALSSCGVRCERPAIRYYPLECQDLVRGGQPCDLSGTDEPRCMRECTAYCGPDRIEYTPSYCVRACLAGLAHSATCD